MLRAVCMYVYMYVCMFQVLCAEHMITLLQCRTCSAMGVPKNSKVACKGVKWRKVEKYGVKQ